MNYLKSSSDSRQRPLSKYGWKKKKKKKKKKKQQKNKKIKNPKTNKQKTFIITRAEVGSGKEAS